MPSYAGPGKLLVNFSFNSDVIYQCLY